MNIIKIFIASFGTFLLLLNNVFAAPSWKEAVKINCYGLPGCVDKKIEDPSMGYVGDRSNIWWEYLLSIIATMLQYVSVFAVIALMLSWVLYLFSAGEEEKVKKAKNWIIWALVWVIVSMSSWFLVSLVNNFSFDAPII